LTHKAEDPVLSSRDDMNCRMRSHSVSILLENESKHRRRKGVLTRTSEALRRLGQSSEREQNALGDGLFSLSGKIESTRSVVWVVKEVELVRLGLDESQQGRRSMLGVLRMRIDEASL
jgi:hypothetical protein